jgi:putative transposase
MATFLRGSFQISDRRACRVLELQRSVYYYRHRRDPQTELRVRLRDLAAARVRYGYERLHTLLRREGWQINHKRVYRLYHEEGLSLRLKQRRNESASDACRSRGPRRRMNAGAWILCTTGWQMVGLFAC